MSFENPYYLLFLLAIPLYLLLKYSKRLKAPAFPYPWIALVKAKGQDIFAWAAVFFQDLLILGCIAALSVALARPRGGSTVSDERNLGVDIVLVTDVSGSMRNVDQIPSHIRRMGDQFFDVDGALKSNARLEIAKRVMKNYIDKQEYNRIGLVLFGTFALTKAPLSSDKELLKNLTDEIQPFEEGNTAIGTGVLTALNRLKNSKAKSRLVILLTDGMNNAGIVDPITAANAARELGVRLYAIGIGNKNAFLAPIDRDGTVYQLGGNAEFDETVLQQMAQITGGKFYLAQNENTLQEIYDEINALEKSEFNVKRRILYEERFTGWLKLSAVLLALWVAFSALVIRIP